MTAIYLEHQIQSSSFVHTLKMELEWNPGKNPGPVHKPAIVRIQVQ